MAGIPQAEINEQGAAALESVAAHLRAGSLNFLGGTVKHPTYEQNDPERGPAWLTVVEIEGVQEYTFSVGVPLPPAQKPSPFLGDE